MTDSWDSCTKPLQSWSGLTLDDMVFAYRKAKVDCFGERAVSTSQLFGEYELALQKNLRRLLDRLRDEGERDRMVSDHEVLGKQLLIAKKLRTDDKSRKGSRGKAGSDGAFFSDKQLAFQHILENKDLTAEFRVAGVLSVDLHVLSALWVNRVGHRLDATLGKHAYGSRVRRFGDDGSPNDRPYHLRAMGSMPPYYQAYRRWREDGMAAVCRELNAGQQVICITLDLSNYFHRIDPSFAAQHGFLARIGLGGKGHPQLAPGDAELNHFMCRLLTAWSESSREYIRQHAKQPDQVIVGGIPIGLTAARVLANVLLQPWDKLVIDSLAPIYYGRYVDDMFLVLRDPGSLSDGRKVMEHIARHLPTGTLKGTGGERRLHLGDWQRATELVLQDRKHKVFFLAGQAGLDLMNVIRDEIRDLASERRLMPEGGGRMRMASAHVLAASSDVRERSDTLRRADGLSIRRMGWAIQLRWAETLTLDLPPKNWDKERGEFFEFATNHVLRPDRLLDHTDYLPRLLGVALACEDWGRARKVIEQARAALDKLRRACDRDGGSRLNGYDVGQQQDAVWGDVVQGFGHQIWEAVFKSWPGDVVPDGDCPALGADARAKFLSLLMEKFPLGSGAVGSVSDAWSMVGRVVPLLADCDQARTPYKELWASGSLPDGVDADSLGVIEESFGGAVGEPATIRHFLDQARTRLGDHAGRTRSRFATTELRALLFPTRPLSVREIAEWDPSCVSSVGAKTDEDPVRRWARMARAFRGIWTRLEPQPRLAGEPGKPADAGIHVVTVGDEANRSTRVLCISNFATFDDAWNGAAAGDPILSLDRYDQFARFVNSILQYRRPPDYVLLPELCVPRRWVASMVNRLLQKGISVVAGVEYKCSAGVKAVRNEAVLALTDDRLGFPSSVLIWQAKSAPAPAEEHLLLTQHGVELEPPPVDRPFPVYRHRGLDMAVLVCSELQDIRLRAALRAQVDCLMVLAWNKDLETFSALVESAALDVHAYVALVNNRRYGDGRVRAPAKELHKRDLCRVRGGLEDYAVLVEIDIEKLRKFQSRAKNWVSDSDPFKPVPQGFSMPERRRSIPGTESNGKAEQE
jgi:hypothetical protein